MGSKTQGGHMPQSKEAAHRVVLLTLRETRGSRAYVGETTMRLPIPLIGDEFLQGGAEYGADGAAT